MHSRLFAIRIIGKDIPETFEPLNENIDFDLVSRFADYIKNSNQEDDLKWLKTATTKVFSRQRKNKKGEIIITVLKEDVINSLKKSFEEFQNKAEDLKFENFSHPYALETFDLKNLLYGDDFGFHFCLMGGKDTVYYTGFDNETQTLRYLLFKMNQDKVDSLKLRFEGSLDYHN